MFGKNKPAKRENMKNSLETAQTIGKDSIF